MIQGTSIALGNARISPNAVLSLLTAIFAAFHNLFGFGD